MCWHPVVARQRPALAPARMWRRVRWQPPKRSTGTRFNARALHRQHPRTSYVETNPWLGMIHTSARGVDQSAVPRVSTLR